MAEWNWMEIPPQLRAVGPHQPVQRQVSGGAGGALAHRNFRTQRLPTKIATAAQIDTPDGFFKEQPAWTTAALG